ncbi:pyrroline-5-carboxylate reductase 2 [Nematostella vectensis]|uniref:pyrroline-5-carboxylate reductase 2 n=1 Tax=Nematostella vectensis TaxID=45351 RepID=UPI0020776587|nr:pyrroline-5-carboxylate reductase 2 [Nematostella vectensis]
MSIGFLGAGKMAQAMARGLLASGTFTREQIIASSIDDITSKEMRGLGIHVTDNNCEAAGNKDIVIVAVKPNVVKDVLSEIAPVITPKNLVVSIAAGVSLKSMEKCLPHKSRVVRVMPNIPTLVRAGASAYALGHNAIGDDSETVKRLMSAVGYVQQVREKDVAAVTGLSGSGPAYCFMAIEALADGGVKAGLPRQVAINLAAHTLMGAAKLVLETGKHPGELKDSVCSPEGSTAYAIHSLERAGLRATLMDAVDAALRRTIELGKIDKL